MCMVTTIGRHVDRVMSTECQSIHQLMWHYYSAVGVIQVLYSMLKDMVMICKLMEDCIWRKSTPKCYFYS